MKVADPARSQVRTDDHPTGVLGFRYLLRGTENTPGNYVMLLAENLGRFEMVRHRHNFDQFRYVVSGQMNLGDGDVLREGGLCYFPEGTPYGPQDDAAGPVVLTLQFGGAHGYGYMSPEQYLAGRRALAAAGRFEGPVYIRTGADGRATRKFSINAIWQEAMGERMLIPAPRYSRPILIDPRAFRWTGAARPGVWRRFLGSFSERAVAAEMLRLEPGAALAVGAAHAIRLLFVLDGQGSLAEHALARHFAVHLDAGEGAELKAGAAGMELLLFTLPMLDARWRDAETQAEEPMPEESVVHADASAGEEVHHG